MNTPVLTPLMPERLTNLRTRAALASVQLHVYDDHETGKTVYLVSRWNLTKQLDSIQDAEKWLDHVTGVKA